MLTYIMLKYSPPRPILGDPANSIGIHVAYHTRELYYCLSNLQGALSQRQAEYRI